MREEFLPFSRPSITDKEIDAVVEVLRSGWITTGRKTAEFEQRICEYTGSNAAVGLSSATGGMHVALKALGIGPGDEVITASMTWVSTVNLIVLAGAKPVFADIDKGTMMLTRETIAACITDKTRLIIPVHFAGAPADMDAIRELARQKGIALLEDAAHAIGAEYKGQRIGKTGTAIFSFHPIKNITTGEGGMLCSDDSELVDRVRSLKFHGLGVDAYDRKTQGRSPQAEVIEPGYKYNMTDIAGAMGLKQLERLDEMNRKRRELAMMYKQRLAEVNELLPLTEPEYDHKHAWHLFIVRVDTDKTGMSRDEFMEKLKERNIGTGLHFRAVHGQKYYRENFPEAGRRLANTQWNSDRICSLPLFPDMMEDDVDDVIEAIKDVLVVR